MEEAFKEAQTPLTPEGRIDFFRAELLRGADSQAIAAEIMDRSARRDAIEQYIQWFTNEADMPLPSKRVMIAPLKPEQAIAGIAEACIYYPAASVSFLESETESKIVFIKTIHDSGQEQRFLISGKRFIPFSDKQDLESEVSILEAADMFEDDPGILFAFKDHGREIDEQEMETHNLQLEILERVVRNYKLKAQPPIAEQLAS